MVATSQHKPRYDEARFGIHGAAIRNGHSPDAGGICEGSRHI
jgi:hypothetical protein